MFSLDLLATCFTSNINVMLLFRYLHVSFRDLLKKLKKKNMEISIFLLKKFCILYLWIIELAQNHPTPPLSPELPGSCQKEFKENKEPSPKARRKRSVKISSVALESVHWQNDSVQIIASASDLKSMDEFLLKKVYFACSGSWAALTVDYLCIRICPLKYVIINQGYMCFSKLDDLFFTKKLQ